MTAPAPEPGPAEPESPDSAGPPGLSDFEREVLAFEHVWFRYPGAKEQAIRDRFDLSATRYFQVLNVLIDEPAAMLADPLLVKRLRRIRAARQQARSAGRAKPTS